MSREQRSNSLIQTEDPEGLLIKLKKDVLYVLLMDASTQDSNKIRAKLLDINATKTYKPGNDTAAVLLYFLSREDNDPVLLRDYLDIFANFKKETEIKEFLVDLDEVKRILDVRKVPIGTQGANKNFLDPANLLTTLTDPNLRPRFQWLTPSLEMDQPGKPSPICRTTTYYSLGSIAFNVRR